MKRKARKPGSRKRADVLTLYKGIRKPMAPPTRVEDRHASRAAEKAKWQREEEE